MGGAPRLNVSIDYPHFRLQLQNGSPAELGEVRRILEALGDDDPSFEEGTLLELRARLSEEFFSHGLLLERVRNGLVLDEDIRVVKRVIPLERELDLETGKETAQLSTPSVKGGIAHLFDGLDTTRIRECLVHIRGDLPRDQQIVIMDAIRQRFGVAATPRFFSTRKNLEGNVLVEAVCFGQGLGPAGEAW